MTVHRTIRRLLLGLVFLPTLGFADVLQNRSTADVPLSTIAQQSVVVVDLMLPAADVYEVRGKASVVNWSGKEDYDRCYLVLAQKVFDQAVTVTGGPHAPSAATVVTQARIVTTAPNQKVELRCGHDSIFDSIKIDGGAQLVATRASKGPPGDAGAPGKDGSPGSTDVAICTSPNGSLPTSQSCSCPAGKVSRPAEFPTTGTCTATAPGGSCTAHGLVLQGSVYTGACCTCKT